MHQEIFTLKVVKWCCRVRRAHQDQYKNYNSSFMVRTAHPTQIIPNYANYDANYGKLWVGPAQPIE